MSEEVEVPRACLPLGRIARGLFFNEDISYGAVKANVTYKPACWQAGRSELTPLEILCII